jgi:hypothetical protein
LPWLVVAPVEEAALEDKMAAPEVLAVETLDKMAELAMAEVLLVVLVDQQ